MIEFSKHQNIKISLLILLLYFILFEYLGRNDSHQLPSAIFIKLIYLVLY